LFSSHLCPWPPVSLEVSSSNDSPVGRRIFGVFFFFSFIFPALPSPPGSKNPWKESWQVNRTVTHFLRQRVTPARLRFRCLSGPGRAVPGPGGGSAPSQRAGTPGQPGARCPSRLRAGDAKKQP